jgi:hypothetical protein
MFHHRVCIFDRKIGCFPLVTYERAKSSVNQQARACEVKSIGHITRDVIMGIMIQRVLSAIREKWPRDDIDKPFYIVQDNALSHFKCGDPLFCEAAKQGGFDIQLNC